MKLLRLALLPVAAIWMTAAMAKDAVEVPMDAASAVETETALEAEAPSVAMNETVAESPAADTVAPTAAPAPVLKLVDEKPAYEPHRGMDWRMFKSVTNPATRPYKFLEDQTWVGIPLFFAGMIAKSEKAAFRQNYNNPNTRIRLIKYNFHSEIDNYTQYVPLALTIGLHLGGYEGRSDWPRFWASSAMSAAIMAGLVNGIKYTAKEMRPDGSTRNAWPSGHTATAFLAATILHKEYGMTRSPWFSVGAYTLATATGVMRVLNNRHWISDVLSGAGIGILSVAPHPSASFKFDENVCVGNVAFYGATSGKGFVNGLAGQRFGVRNSGATLVVEGVGKVSLAELATHEGVSLGEGNDGGAIVAIGAEIVVGHAGQSLIGPHEEGHLIAGLGVGHALGGAQLHKAILLKLARLNQLTEYLVNVLCVVL